MILPLNDIPVEYGKKVCKIYDYGTAGFREKDDELPPIMFRMGILAALRSLTKAGQAIGVMITASHNPEGENGVKLIDPKGDMLASSWEVYAAKLVNASDGKLSDEINNILKCLDVNSLSSAKVFCSRDNRLSGESLAEAVRAGVMIIPNAIFVSYGVLTTPQLHYIIRYENSSQGTPTELGYYNKYASTFNAINSKIMEEIGDSSNYDNVIYIDAANGVGGPNFAKLLDQCERHLLNVIIVNKGEGPLNNNCGADFVKVERKPPNIYSPGVKIGQLQKWASFDGDADRLVYYFNDQDNVFHLLDGDKIAVLLTSFIGELLEKADVKDMQVGIVQTAYANGNSTEYIKNHFRSVSTYCVPTGVKHLHKQAEQLDVGIYFEANGHGTVLFSEKFKSMLRNYGQEIRTNINRTGTVAMQLLALFVDMINESIGDAMTDLLGVESILRYKNWSILDWDHVYTDLPSKQLKIKVTDRTVIKTTDAERVCTEPHGLQDSINSVVAKFKQARAFVRPSGTENVVRIYAEADSEVNVYNLATEVAVHVYDLAQGTGPKPVINS